MNLSQLLTEREAELVHLVELAKNTDKWSDVQDFARETAKAAYLLGLSDALSKVKRKHEKAGTVYVSDTWEAGYHDALFDSEASIVRLHTDGEKIALTKTGV